MKFYKELMLKRIEREGMMEYVGDKELAIMDNLDGQDAETVNWRRTVYHEPVYYVVGKDGVGEYVNENDCK